MIVVDRLNKEYGVASVLNDVSFSIGRGQKVALVGNNGSGKSTLMKLIAGLEFADSGSIRLNPDVRIGYVPQVVSFQEDETVADYLRIECEDDVLFKRRAMMLLSGFEIRSEFRERRLSTLSGGQKRKVALARVFLDGSNTLLLDEPTNDLDLSSIVWLERILLDSNLTVLVASHDRRFLNRVARTIVEIDDVTHRIDMTKGTYAEYLEAGVKKRERLCKEYESQQKEIVRLKDRAQALKLRGEKGNTWEGTDHDKLLRDFKRDRSKRSGVRAKAIEKRLEHMDVLQKPFEREPLKFLLHNNKKHGNRDIELEDVVVGYPNGFRLKRCSLHLPFGIRYGLVGSNGCGKSTLVHTIVGDLIPLGGLVRIGSGIRFGHLTQEHELLDREMTPLEFLRTRAGIHEEEAFFLLDVFGIDPKRASDRIGQFSPGAHVRLIFALFSCLGVNALVLDEPTNHLDIEALLALEEALEGFDGTIILVSHDRAFIERVKLDAIYLLEESGKISSVGDFRTFIERVEDEALLRAKSIRL